MDFDFDSLDDFILFGCMAAAADDGKPAPKSRPTRLDRWPWWGKVLITVAVGYVSVKLTLLFLRWTAP